MSEGPDAPVEKQARNHAPALIGMVVAVLVVILALFIFGVFDSEDVSDEETVTTSEPVADAEVTEETAEEVE